MFTYKQTKRILTNTLTFVMLIAIVPGNVTADPCGMVPPIYTGPGSPIARIGLQQTYCFHKDGVETFVIRPGFTGNVDNFGMLIPFPTPPELRKVPDNVFEHIANAIDPPEVVVDLRMRFRRGMAMGGAVPMAAKMEVAELADDKVQVLKEEAVGMYEVAVLAAGSADALKKWMDQKGFQYPKGMDKVTNEYIDIGWCFVAVKTKVGKKSDADPKPGQRNANPQLPKDGSFDGHVQGMGFRFRSEKLVVPMRLSAFNDGDLRNVVYLLTDGPRKIRSIPEEYVVRQISGDQLIKNVSNPLPLRIIGGTEADIPEYRRKNLDKERNPFPKNGSAKELFASDLLAVSTGNLSLEHEEMEKEFLRIGEYFGLRGNENDANNALALKEMRDKTVSAGLAMLKGMTLTVVDGDFPRKVVANENLQFAEYTMPAGLNTTLNYDATLYGPGVKKEGTLKVGMIDWDEVDRQVSLKKAGTRTAAGSLFGIASLGCFFVVFRRKPAALLVFVLMLGFAVSKVVADDDVKVPERLDDMIEMLKDSKTAPVAMEQILKNAKMDDKRRDNFVKRLVKVSKTDEHLPRRGWAIASLAKIGGTDVDEYLLDIHADEKQAMLVRSWAAAARVQNTRTANGLIEKANLIQQFPALGRPIGVRLVEKMSAEANVKPEDVIGVMMKVPQLQNALTPSVLAFGPKKLVNVMINAEDDKTRRMAAGYLGSFGAQGESSTVADCMLEQLAFNSQASSVPWDGGALFVPQIQWGKEDAQTLVGNLIRWHLWCDINGNSAVQAQIHNNIRSLGLAGAAGYKSPGWQNVDTLAWLKVWGNLKGTDELREILEEQGVLKNKRYSSVLN